MSDQPPSSPPDDQNPPRPPDGAGSDEAASPETASSPDGPPPAPDAPGPPEAHEPPPKAPPPPRDPPPPSGGAAGPSNDERSWAMLCHMLALAGLMMPVVLNVVVPLIMWQLKKNESSFVDDQGKESLNFQITVSLALIVLGFFSVVPVLGCLALPALLVVGIGAVVFAIIGGIKANEGAYYRYPIALRLVN